MGGRRTSKEELAKLEAYTKEGYTGREIAEKLGRSPAAIRNLRYKKHLVTGMKDEVKVLFQQRDELSNMVKNLQGQKSILAREVDDLVKEKEKLLQDGPDLKELEFLCHKYGDVTESIAIKKAVHNSYLEAFHGPFAEMIKNLENLKF